MKLLRNAKLAVFIATILLVAVYYFAVNAYAKATYLKAFYSQMALAQRHSNELIFPNKVGSDEIDNTGTTSRSASLIKYCSFAGVYHNYESDKTINNARECMKKYRTYFWLPTLDRSRLEAVNQRMIQQGWKSVLSADDFAAVEARIVDEQASGEEFDYTRSDGTYADVMFLNRDGHGIDPSGVWCMDDSRRCHILVPAAKSHQFFLEVDVYAYKGFED